MTKTANSFNNTADPFLSVQMIQRCLLFSFNELYNNKISSHCDNQLQWISKHEVLIQFSVL